MHPHRRGIDHCARIRAHLGRAHRVVNRIRRRPNHRVERGVAGDGRPGAQLFAGKRRHGRLLAQFAQHLQPLAQRHAVGLFRQVIRVDQGPLARVVRGDGQPAPALGLELGHVDGEAMAAILRRRPVERQRIDEMQLRVRRAVARPEPQERAGLEPLLGAHALAGEEPLRAHGQIVGKLRMIPERQRLGHAVLDLDLEVIVQVLAHTRKIGADRDAQRAQLRRRANARVQKQVRRADGAGAEHHVPGREHLLAGGCHHQKPVDAGAVSGQAQHFDACLHLEIRAAPGAPQIGAGGAVALAVLDVDPEQPEALGLTLDGLMHVIAPLAAGLDKGIVGGPALGDHRGHDPGDLVEHRLHLGPGPALAARGCPVVVIRGVAGDPDHGVDRRRAAQNLAARHVKPAAIHMGLRHGFEVPVEARRGDGLGHASRHRDERVAPGGSGLEQQHPAGGIAREALGHGAACAAGADDDDVPAHARSSRRAASIASVSGWLRPPPA